MELHQERVLKVLFVLIWVLAVAHMMAEVYFLYWAFEWYDILTHFLGGLWVGMAALWFWYLSGYIRDIETIDFRALPIAILAGLVIGVVWEGYEYGVWMWSGSGLPINYMQDTSLDIVVDVFGALFGYVAFKRLFFSFL
jgi:hypothetical protein